MSDFSAALYIENIEYKYKLDDLIHRSFNGYLDQDITCTEQKMYFPIIKGNESYYLYSSINNWAFSINGVKINAIEASPELIKHGDLLRATCDKQSYSVIFTENAYCSASSIVYGTEYSSPIFIGRGDDMNIVIKTSGSVSRKHAVIHAESSRDVYIEDISGKTGVFVNGMKTVRQKLVCGDEISIGSTSIVFLSNALVVPSNITVHGLSSKTLMDTLNAQGDDSDSCYYVRTPRIYKSLEKGVIEIDSPTQPQKVKEVPFILSAGPSLTMTMAMFVGLGVTVSNALQNGNMGSVITGGVMSASMLAGSLLWPKLLRNYNEKQRIRDEQHRQSRYLTYIADKEHEISKLYDRNTRVWNDTLYPSPQVLLSILQKKDKRIWERTPEDADFLSVRLGVGERPFEIDILSKKNGFILDKDELVTKPRELIAEYGTLRNVPITISLIEKRTVGAIGDTMDLIRSIVINLTFYHSSDEVKLVLVYNQRQKQAFGNLMSLPHVWSDDRSRRFAATTKAEAHALFSYLEEAIQEREQSMQKDDNRIPHYVVLVFDAVLVADVPFRKHLLDYSNKLGVTSIFFGSEFSALPKECSAIIQMEENNCGMYLKNENNNRFLRYLPDSMSTLEFNEFVSDMAHMVTDDKAGSSGIPDRVTFLDSYQVGNIGALGILNRWNTNASDKSLAAIIGVRGNNEAFMLDIHEKYHGCHGLVAGTTGSGKSEFLQAYILSMMINFSPNEASFVLIDFKGGDMARPFLRAPHLAATISNLSENTLYRALVSLEAEVKSRQRTMNMAAQQLGIDKLDINSYHRYYKEKRLLEPLPHLIIVIDEFAQLKSQHSEFMTKLIDVAQVGRSLGIHLILATQKPSGVVDPQIWSNSRFKVCLKVTDKQDSLDMVNHPDAAYIKLPGRAYVQIGYDEVFEPIQAGYSGAEYIANEKYIDDDSTTVSLINAPCEKIRSVKDVRMPGKGNRRSQLEEIVAEICLLGKKQHIRSKPLWMPELPTSILYEDCNTTYKEFMPSKCDVYPLGHVSVGFMDLPATQKQMPFEIDLVKNGHIAIYGSTGTGTSTFLKTVAYALAIKYSPKWLNTVVLDFDGGSLLPLSKMPHCIGYTNGNDERKLEQVFYNIQDEIEARRELFAQSNCSNYESYIAEGGKALPLMLIILDNYSAFRESMFKMEESIIRVVAAGKSCGMYFMITGNSKNAIYYKVTDHIANLIVFGMNDTGAYRDILNVRTPIKPEGVKGRALVLQDGMPVEVQIAVPFDTSNESERNRKMHAAFLEMIKAFGSAPSFISSYYDAKCDDWQDGGASNTSTTVTLSGLPSITDMTAPIIIGRTLDRNTPCGFDTNGSLRLFIGNAPQCAILCGLTKAAVSTGCNTYLISNRDDCGFDGVKLVEDIDEFINDLCSTPSETRIIVLIDGFCDFYDRISDDSMSELERYLQNKGDSNFVIIDDMKRIRDYRDTELFIHFVRSQNGCIFGGGIDNDTASLLHSKFNELPVDVRQKKLSPHQAFIYSGKCGVYAELGTGEDE